MYKIPFFIGTFLSWFVPGRNNRRNLRGRVNVFFFWIPIALFVKRVYGVRVKKIRFVRQISMKRMTCVVNDRYYVKIFRFVSVQRLNDYKFLLDYIKPKLPVKIPEIFVAKHIPMYVTEKMPGKDMRDFDKDVIVKNEKSITKQVFNLIKALKSIDVHSIPNNERFINNVQSRAKYVSPVTKTSVLAHCDLNAGNLRLDDKLKLVSIIDWDSMLIVPDPDRDEKVFTKLWEIYKK